MCTQPRNILRKTSCALTTRFASANGNAVYSELPAQGGFCCHPQPPQPWSGHVNNFHVFSFGHITPEHVTVSLQEHYSQAEKHLLRTLRLPVADAVEHPNAQAPLYPFQLVRTEALFPLH
jgi:hypothetical protein